MGEGTTIFYELLDFSIKSGQEEKEDGMGDKTTINGLKCGHCGKKQNDVYYAYSSGFLTHKCNDCGKENAIIETYQLIPIAEKRARKKM